MRIKIEGRFSADELLQKLEWSLRHFEDQFRVERFTGLNIYFTPRDVDGQELELLADDGEPIGEVIFIEPKVPRRRKPKLKVVGGKKPLMDHVDISKEHRSI
jgi:hypothetical protein